MTPRDANDGKDQFNVYLSASVIRDVKHAAIDSGQKLGEFVERIFEDWLRRHRGDKRGERS
jgi:hypothetical protein